MENNRVKLENGIKKYKLYLITIVLLSIILVFFLGKIYEKSEQPLPEPLKIVNANNTDVYASVSVQMLTDPFASDDEDEYYFAMDKDKYLCIVVLNKNNVERLKQIIDYTYSEDEGMTPEAITITGRTKEITSDLKEIAIESYNEMIEEDFLNEDNFEDYFGNIYLNTKLSAVDYSTETFAVCVVGIILFILLFYYLRAVITTKKTIRKYTLNGSIEYIYSQLDQMDTVVLASGKTFLTREYIIDISSGLVIFKYDDIKWVYPFKVTQYGVTVGRYIQIVNIENKKFKILAMEGFAKKYKVEEFENAYIEICKRAPHALCGYTTENSKKAKNI